MSFVRLGKYIFRQDDIGAITYSQAYHGSGSNKHIVHIHYLNGNSLQIDFDNCEDCEKAFDKIANLLGAK